MGGVHHEIPVRVKAWVDEGIAPLVVALNEFENVWTLGSCENDRSALAQGAYVLFEYRGGGSVDRFVADLALGLGESIPHSLEIDRRGEDEPLLILSCPSDRVRDLAAVVSALACGSADGSPHTEPQH